MPARKLGLPLGPALAVGAGAEKLGTAGVEEGERLPPSMAAEGEVLGESVPPIPPEALAVGEKVGIAGVAETLGEPLPVA